MLTLKCQAYDFDPLGQGPQVGEYPLTRLLCSERLPPIELGKVYGNTTLWLLPRPGSLPISEIKVPRKVSNRRSINPPVLQKA